MSLGLLVWSHATTWPDMLVVAKRADALEYDHIWTSDHLLATVGDPSQPIFEGWMTLGAWSAHLTQARLGLLVSANTLRHPALISKMAATLDHMSAGRALLGLGAGWFEPEHTRHGIPFGRSAGQRLDWLEESVGLVRRLLNGELVNHQGVRYECSGVRHAPQPIQARLPIMIGGGGERKTLGIVARHADMWNVFGTPEEAGRKLRLLELRCQEIGRDPAEIEKTVTVKLVMRDTHEEARRVWGIQCDRNGMNMRSYPDALLGSPEMIASALDDYLKMGFTGVIADCPAPYDLETVERLRIDLAGHAMSRRGGQRI